MSKIEGLLFDLDGLVIDSELARDKVTRDLVASLGFNYDRDKLKPRMSGKPGVKCMQVLVEEYDLSISAEELEAKRRERIAELYRQQIPFVPGFKRFFETLRATFDVPVAIATSLERSYFKLVDKRLGISPLFNGHVYHTENVERGKPDPDIFLFAAEKIGVAPENCGVFEDAPNGIVASIRAGARTVALTRTFTKEILVASSFNLLGRDLKEGEDVIFIPDFSDSSLERVRQYLL